jgi:hypothetical protein
MRNERIALLPAISSFPLFSRLAKAKFTLKRQVWFSFFESVNYKIAVFIANDVRSLRIGKLAKLAKAKTLNVRLVRWR